MSKHEIISNLGKLLAGLQVPLSMGVPLGAAREPYVKVLGGLRHAGWMEAADLEQALREVLEIDP